MYIGTGGFYIGGGTGNWIGPLDIYGSVCLVLVEIVDGVAGEV